MSNSGKRYTAEQIIHILREIDVLSSNGHSLQMACKQAGTQTATTAGAGLSADH